VTSNILGGSFYSFILLGHCRIDPTIANLKLALGTVVVPVGLISSIDVKPANINQMSRAALIAISQEPSNVTGTALDTIELS
jgi:hypothetical protein